jgi:hypothetical protein
LQPERCVDPGHDPLARRLLVPGGPVDLPGKIEPGQAPNLESVPELVWGEVVVLDGVAHPRNPRLLQSRHRAEKSLLDLRGREVESPFTYSSRESSPSGSRKTWCLGLSGKRTTLSSMEGQYRGPGPEITPRRVRFAPGSPGPPPGAPPPSR